VLTGHAPPNIGQQLLGRVQESCRVRAAIDHHLCDQLADVHPDVALLSDRTRDVRVPSLQTALETLIAFLAHTRDDGVPLRQCTGNETTEPVEENRIARIEQHMMTM
jgi:hypothetical protein